MTMHVVQYCFFIQKYIEIKPVLTRVKTYTALYHMDALQFMMLCRWTQVGI